MKRGLAADVYLSHCMFKIEGKSSRILRQIKVVKTLFLKLRTFEAISVK